MTRRRTRDEAGYVALVVAILFSSVMLGLAAIGVDVARWYVEAERVQTAADAAALAGVVYLPDNMAKAVTTARKSAELNGYEHGVNAEVTVGYGERRSQLDVTISTEVDNQFGAAIGVDTATVGRRAAADYTSPAPMGSPCNTFGNEPLGGSDANSGPRLGQSTCASQPNLWGAIEGPDTDKASGDRYSTTPCGPADPGFSATYGCAASRNSEATYPEGYFFAVRVTSALIGKSVRLQIFDPAFYHTGTSCTLNMPTNVTSMSNTANKYTTDARTRYLSGSGSTRPFCTGDVSLNTSKAAPVTSFALRGANDASDPMEGPGIAGCTAQFRGYTTAPSTNNLTSSSGSYNDAAAKTFRQWVDLCSFTPTRAGNYFVQVRTNVELGGVPESNGTATPIVYRNNPNVLLATGARTTGNGANAFALRAIAPSNDQVAVSGWARMPMLQNAPGTVAEFHMLRVLPSAAGQSISFEFFDSADVNETTTQPGKVTVLPPVDATGTITTTGLTGCTQALNDATFAPADVGCSVKVSRKTHNGQLQRMSIPIPDDYTCTDTTQSGCWFKIRVELGGTITDVTTWDASLEGDPVRLIE
ncbi:hypothetical protein GCM10009737_21470 [Nocardioides lentus]|uniref:Putative Flp pilus-assembly TadG-like N-terminal domain-containing protein n=1 Tax=Nocardioides lentus TaxID=338077 RepID=A0ABP5APV9_9ACTN